MLLRATGGDDNDRFSGEMNATVAWIRGVRWSNFCRVLGNYGRNMALFSSLFFFLAHVGKTRGLWYDTGFPFEGEKSRWEVSRDSGDVTDCMDG